MAAAMKKAAEAARREGLKSAEMAKREGMPMSSMSVSTAATAAKQGKKLPDKPEA